ncbi:ADP-ribosyl-[dinitrogen reductase] glycohydrolase [hydrothermal vent metagenome]|uniref:ADP-ribosyl-[dinitrogen reductase] glycohydrolase n=1 Tax=hydrothermal vent metagenome TaxID=652676 RepID=A0A3B1BDB9_9ZZZZ
MSDILLQRAQAAYLGVAIGDALGATVEFMTPREIRASYGMHRDIIGGGWLRLRRGYVTDDTQMSLALGRAILDKGEFQASAVAEAFSEWMRSKPIDIGNTVRRGIMHYRSSGQTEVPANEHDAGNGACMRSLPIALLTLGQPWAEVQALSRQHCHITHHNPLSDRATEYVIKMVQVALRAGERQSLETLAQELVEHESKFKYNGKRSENPSAYIVETMHAVLQAFFEEHTFEAALINVVNRGGDADTTGAILGMISGAFYGLDAIPPRWLQSLNAEIRDACSHQARQLIGLSRREIEADRKDV